MTKRDRYLKQIYAIFTEFGVKSFTLEELAAKIGVTKMTLYNNFKNKDLLINEIVLFRERAFKEHISSVEDGSNNAITMLFQVLSFQRSNPHPNSMIFYKSLKANYPTLYSNYIDNFKAQLGSFIESNLERGIGEGIYVESISPKIISGYVLAAMDNMFSGSVDSDQRLDLNTMHRDMIAYHLRGIVNEKGQQVLSEVLSNIPGHGGHPAGHPAGHHN